MPLSGQDLLFADVVERLRAAANADRAIDAAQMHLINLQDIIKSAGPTWPLVKDSIRLGSMRFLRGCLGDDDIVIPAGDGFLIIFAQGEPSEMKARAQEMRVLLLEFYLGQNSLMKDLKVEVEHRRIEAKEIGALIAAAPKPAVEPVNESCGFAPVWSASGQVVASYFCTPVHHEAWGMRFGYDRGYAETGALAHRDYAKLDVMMLDAVEMALGRVPPGGVQPVLGISVHATTIHNRIARAAFLERLARFPADALKHLCIKIAEIETGAPVINLADWTGMLRARVRTILLEFHPSEALPPNLTDVGVWGAGFVAPRVESEAEMAALVRHTRRWAEALGREKKKLFVDNLRQPFLVRAAAAAGAAFLTSEVLWPVQKWPGGVVQAPLPASFATPKNLLMLG